MFFFKINVNNYSQIDNVLGLLIESLITHSRRSEDLRKAIGLRSMQEFLKTIFWFTDNEFESKTERANFLDKSFEIHVQYEEDEDKRQKKTLNIVCRSPSIG